MNRPCIRRKSGRLHMGRYPVTVLNYLQFMEAGGYSQEEFWSAGGFGEYTEPGSWQRQLRYPNRPVVEVSWFEAAAYCAWAGGRLPTRPSGSVRRAAAERASGTPGAIRTR